MIKYLKTAIAMGGGGSSGNTTTTTEPPEFLLPYLQQAAAQAQRNFGAGPLLPPSQSAITPFNPLQLAGQQQAVQFATGQQDVSSLFPTQVIPGFSNNQLAVAAPTQGTDFIQPQQPGGPSAPRPFVPGDNARVVNPAQGQQAASGQRFGNQLPQPSLPGIGGQTQGAPSPAIPPAPGIGTAFKGLDIPGSVDTANPFLPRATPVPELQFPGGTPQSGVPFGNQPNQGTVGNPLGGTPANIPPPTGPQTFGGLPGGGQIGAPGTPAGQRVEQTLPNLPAAPGSLPAQIQQANQAQSQLLQGGQGLGSPLGQLIQSSVGGINQLGTPEQQVQQQLLGLAGNAGANQTIQQALAAAGASGQLPQGGLTGDALTTLFTGSPLEQPGVQGSLDAINRQVSRQLNEQTLPGIGDAALGAGQFGSSRQGVSEGIAQRGASEAIADATARLTLQASQQQQQQQQQVLQQLLGQQFGAGQQQANILSGAFGTGVGAAGGALQGQRGANIAQGQTGANVFGQLLQSGDQNALRALALAPQTAQLGLLPSQILQQTGAQQQGQQQALTNESLQRFLQTQNAPNQQLQQYLANLGVITPGAGQTTTQAGGGPSTLQSGLGGAATGAAIGSVIPGLGTGIGAGIGGLIGLFG